LLRLGIAVEAFNGRKLCRLDAPLDRASFAVYQFQFDQAGQELNMVEPLGGALAGQFGVFPQDRRQLQRLEMML